MASVGDVATLPDFTSESGSRTVHTTCYMCACRCGLEVKVEDNRIRFIKGIAEHPVNKGVWCAKGGAGIMTQYSPARLTTPLMRDPTVRRGDGGLKPVDWDTALSTLAGWLGEVRRKDPRRLAYFTGRDQMQAFNGFWAQQFGTPNWAAHGGFCSVNMAAAGMYSVGGSMWEFGWPDLDHSRWFMLLGVAEDHPSNPLKLSISALKDRGGRFVVVNPVRSGYGALADEWVPIRPGTDGALLMAFMHVLWNEGLYDREFLARYTNAAQLVRRAPGTAGDGMFARGADGAPLVLGPEGQPLSYMAAAGEGRLSGRVAVDGEVWEPAAQLLAHRLMQTTPKWAEPITGVPRRTIVRLALEMGETAFQHPVTLPIPWTDIYGVHHDATVGRPVAFHAMRGLAAHTNGFQTIRALFTLMMLLGAVDRPGGFLYKSPYPKPIPPPVKPANRTDDYTPDHAASGPLLGYPTSPDDLLVDGDTPRRIDESYSWKYPLAAHGAIQNVVRNAHDRDPYAIDTLMVYMANLAWNSTWNTLDTRAMLTEEDRPGHYRIPHVVVFDAYDSETVQMADLVLPDTTYLERWDATSLLDRPISEPDGPADSIRQPVVPPPPGVRPTADVLIELAGRLRLPRFVDEQGEPLYRSYRDFIQNWETVPGSGVGLLAGHRGANGDKSLVGEPNPEQLRAYAGDQAYWRHTLPPHQRYFRMANRDYLEWAAAQRFMARPDPIVLNVYSEPLQTFRLAGLGLWPGKKPTDPWLAQRLVRYMDPLASWEAPLEDTLPGAEEYPLRIVTQRPMTHYHSWGSMNAWLRQLLNENPVFVNPALAKAQNLKDGDWVWVESRLGRMTARVRLSDAVEPRTVWTWNAIAKGPGAWGLHEKAPEATRAVLVNHIIPDVLPLDGPGTFFNNDPVTGQAGWYDTRVKIYPSELHEVWPTVPAAEPRRPHATRQRRLAYTTHPANPHATGAPDLVWPHARDGRPDTTKDPGFATGGDSDGR
jgi:anaerobic selenocysteine-containing dehydrogenase